MKQATCPRCRTVVQIEKLCRCSGCGEVLVQADAPDIEVCDLERTGILANEIYKASFVETANLIAKNPSNVWKIQEQEVIVQHTPIRHSVANERLILAAEKRRRPQERKKGNSCFLVVGVFLTTTCLCSSVLYLIGKFGG